MLEIVPVRDSNKDFPGETSVKIPGRNSIKHFLTYVLAIVPTQDSDKESPSETLLKVPA